MGWKNWDWMSMTAMSMSWSCSCSQNLCNNLVTVKVTSPNSSSLTTGHADLSWGCSGSFLHSLWSPTVITAFRFLWMCLCSCVVTHIPMGKQVFIFVGYIFGQFNFWTTSPQLRKPLQRMGQDSIAVGQGEGETATASTCIGLSFNKSVHWTKNLQCKLPFSLRTGWVKFVNHPVYNLVLSRPIKSFMLKGIHLEEFLHLLRVQQSFVSQLNRKEGKNFFNMLIKLAIFIRTAREI